MSAARSGDRIRLGDLLKGVIATLPEVLTVQRGLWNLALCKPTSIGSIGLQLQKLADATPYATALKFDDRRWTYAEFNAWANRCAAACRAAGVKRGQVVAIISSNRPETLAAIAGVVKLGAVAAMLNHNQRGKVLAHSLRLSKPHLLIAGEECAEAVASLDGEQALDAGCVKCWDGAETPEGWLDWSAECDRQPSGNPPETATIQLKEPAFHIFTSGTTGLPKASVMSHYRWQRGMAGLGQMTMRLHGNDTLYCALPLYHNNALTVCWGAVLADGAALALSRKFSASKFWDEIRSYEATAFCYIGELCRYLLNQPPSPKDRQHQIRLMVGNGLRPEIWDEFQNRFGIERIAEFYGASESNLAFVNGFNLSKTAGFCPLSYAIVAFDTDAESAVRNAKDRLTRVASGGVGLLISEVSERAPFDGYTDKRANEAKLLRDVFKKGDCWFNTGDLVRDQGLRHIQFVDRVGDTFRWKGENVATTEVEAALNQIEGIEQAVVYGVEVPGTDGRAGMASLSCAAKRFDGKRIATELRAALPAYAVPLFIRLRKEQEVTATFKYRKVDLKREGFDLEQISEPLYVLDGDSYRKLTPATHAKLQSGSFRP
ncbi:long-chain-acyl-CoA synthetase [Nevskia ramosa]|uniref:long-chain-acyl-CoA synthetase n=1 Tax=Nevskia ramosa TaxID=64002 RepID=UPI0004908488|nr:long-chain-acyl-CoA synthetase [Nevskia ramosa]